MVKQSFIESFNQPARNEGIDVLWVIDDSATMYEEQDLLTSSADAFIGFVSNSGVDFRLALVTTDSVSLVLTIEENAAVWRDPDWNGAYFIFTSGRGKHVTHPRGVGSLR